MEEEEKWRDGGVDEEKWRDGGVDEEKWREGGVAEYITGIFFLNNKSAGALFLGGR